MRQENEKTSRNSILASLKIVAKTNTAAIKKIGIHTKVKFASR